MLRRNHFGDILNAELLLNKCCTLDEVINEINDYMDYYNNDIYQWNLNKMTPAQYKNHPAC